MGMADCAKCWEVQCECGFDLLHESPEGLEKRAAFLLEVAMFLRAHPDAAVDICAQYAKREAAHERFKEWRRIRG